MLESILFIIGGVVGILGTWSKYHFDPKQKIYTELDLIAKEIKVLREKEGRALATNDNDVITIVIFDINELHERQKVLLGRL